MLSHPTLAELRRHQADLLTAFETISPNELSLSDTPSAISERIIRTNFRELIVMYFEIADNFSYNTVPYLQSLSDRMFDDAIRAIRIIWGTNNEMRRSTIEKPLYDYLVERMGALNPISTLQLYVNIAYLTFDKSNPGYKHPPRKQKSQ